MATVSTTKAGPAITDKNWTEYCQTQPLSEFEQGWIEICKQYYARLSWREQAKLNAYLQNHTKEQREARDRWGLHIEQTSNLLYRIMFEDASRTLMRAQIQAYYYYMKAKGELKDD